MVYLSIRQDEISLVVVEYILCDSCADIPDEPEIEQDIILGSEPCEFCGAWNGQEQYEDEDDE